MLLFMAWSGEHRAFVVEEFVKNGKSVVNETRTNFSRDILQSTSPPPPTSATICSNEAHFHLSEGV